MTISRLSAKKGITRAIEALYKSKRRDIHYYIIGDGPRKDEIANLISEYKMEDTVTMLGEQSDPYKYLCCADWLLVPSFHEAAPMVFDEAMLMGVKVITTNTTSAEEMIDSEHGIVCDNSTEGIVRALVDIKKTKKTDKDSKGTYHNEKQKKQLENIFNV